MRIVITGPMIQSVAFLSGVQAEIALSSCALAGRMLLAEVLDEVAWLKRTDALLCDVWNERISPRLLARWGWEPHKPQPWHRNYIKRFYGTYPVRNGPTHAPALESAAC